ncbi:restriction endonuclease subunit S [Rhodanobacter ginsenosidimutans]|uniref:Restriction endonuclease subunit S n=1 Tax=Rhodanobacter ginsenosidimutans TaxID=490571 RepID=A0ABW0JWU9_9GAMM
MLKQAGADQWDMKTLRQLAQINYGRDAKPILDPYGTYPVYGTGESSRCGTSYLYDGDSVVLGRKGTIGRVQFVTGSFWTIDTAYFLSKFSECEPRWIYYVLSSFDLRSLNEATGVPSLAREVLYRLPVSTPPPPEQSKIAEVLSTVDWAIAQTEALIAKQQRIKTGLMQDLLTRGIDEHGQLRSEATHAFKDSPLGRIPVEWESDSIVSSMDQIMDFRGRTPKKLGLDWGGEIPALSAMNVEMGKLNFQKHTNFGDENLYGRWMTHGDAKKGDVIMTTEAPLGNVAQIPNNERYILSQRVILLRGKVGVIDNKFMRHYLSAQLFRKTMHEQSSGTTATGIQRRKLEQLLIRIPPIDEQANISAVIDGCDGEIEVATGQREKFSCLKTALMQDLLTGKVRVTPLLQPAKEATA